MSTPPPDPAVLQRDYLLGIARAMTEALAPRDVMALVLKTAVTMTGGTAGAIAIRGDGRVEGSPTGIPLLDAAGRIAGANGAAERLLAPRPGGLVGQAVAEDTLRSMAGGGSEATDGETFNVRACEGRRPRDRVAAPPPNAS